MKRRDGPSLSYPREEDFDDCELARACRIKVRRLPVKFAAIRRFARRPQKS